jgi:aminodeoxyfutalosine deaminase
MLRVHRAEWVLPIGVPPIRNGWVAVDEGRILSAGGPGNPPPLHSTALSWEPDAGSRTLEAILPGLVNAHTHLELSYLHGRIAPARRFGDWVRGIMAARQQYPDPCDPTIVGAARAAIDAARATGTALFGDVSNTLATVPLLQAAGVPSQVFFELLGFDEPDPAGRVEAARQRADAAAGGCVRVSLAPHAPYSVSAALFRTIRADLDAHPGTVTSVHLGETSEEVEFLRCGTGDIRRVLEELGRWPSAWQPPGVGPVEYLTGLGVLDARMLVVHGVQLRAEDAARLRALPATVVSCPRSNAYVGAGSPPLAMLYELGVTVAFGTDSLASTYDLNVFEELREARRIAPQVSASRLLESATLAGARALGFGDRFGSIEAGKDAALIAVRIPKDVTDVEEYLVSGGVSPGQVRWL